MYGYMNMKHFQDFVRSADYLGMPFIILMLVAILSGCSAVHSNVSQFHKMDSAPPGTFSFVPLDKQKGSLEFETYAKQTSKYLRQNGYTEVKKDDNWRYGVFFSYGVGAPQTISGVMPLYGSTGGGTAYHSGTVSTYGGSYGSYSGTTTAAPSYGIVGSMPYRNTDYPRHFKLLILDRAQPLSDGHFQTVYEGTVTSTGSSDTFAQVGGCMIRSLFEDFPGKSGETRTSRTIDCSADATSLAFPP